VDKFDLSSLYVVNSGAAPLGPDVQRACALRLKCIVKQGWGMTELSPVGTFTPDDKAQDLYLTGGRSGMLLPGTEARILCVNTGNIIDPGQEGELLIRGPQVSPCMYVYKHICVCICGSCDMSFIYTRRSV
jgi:acyl-CoA synthetase (AMP-forming)/AMP-acid ligase II